MSVRIEPGDCLEIMARLKAEGIEVDSVVTDPPYHLQSIHKRFAAKGRDEISERYAVGAYGRHAKGFMGKQWDGGDIAARPETWRLAFDLMKPGAHLVAFGGTRTYHRMACAIEDAGFEIRDQLAWAYGSGFPKSHNVGDGLGTALKPSWEPIVLARKPLIGTVAANVLQHGTGALNIDRCRIGTTDDLNGGAYAANGGRSPLEGDERIGAAAGMFQPGKTADKQFEPPTGRWPANFIHDGSPEVLAGFPAEAGGGGGPKNGGAPAIANVYREYACGRSTVGHIDSGSAARFFYCAKADESDRLGSKHPTVKPVDLMAWLVRLVTPKGGLVLDPFAGTGTTGMACLREGMRAILIEREAEYVADIQRRLDHVHGTDTPLFGGAA